MDDDYGQMFGGEDFMGDIGLEDEAILDYDDGDDNLDLGSDEEEEIESFVGYNLIKIKLINLLLWELL